MSDVDGMGMLPEKDWVEELQRKFFDECATQKSPELVNNEFVANEGKNLCNVPVNVIIDNIHRSFVLIPYFRSQRIEFLEELKNSLHKVERNKRVNWYEFRDSSKAWFLKLLNLLRQDGNNNISLNHSDAPTDVSDKLSVEEHSCSDAIDEDLHSCSLNQMDTVASSYSIRSCSMGCGTIDSMLDTSEDTDRMSDIAGIDLKVKIRRFTEETASLREELVLAEEKIVTLERDLKSTTKSWEQLSKKYTQLQRENEDQKEMLTEAENREHLNKQELQKLKKAYSILEKKLKQYEAEKEHVASLKAKIDKLTNENAEHVRKLIELKTKHDEKVIECEYLQEENIQLKNSNSEMEKYFERNLEHQTVRIKELQDLNAELQSRMNKSDSSRFSLTPPPYSQGNNHIHSTPYNNKARHQDSLYSELKASGFNIDEVKIQDLKEEISFYNEEIATVSQQIDEALQEIAALRNEICVPNLQLVETDDIHTLKHRISSLINVAKSCTSTRPRQEATLREEPREKPDILPETKKSDCLANDRLFGSESREHDLIGSVTSSSMPAVSVIGACARTDRSTSPLPESPLASVDESPEASRHSEEEVIVPIVEALNRIIEIKRTDEEDESETLKRLNRHSKQKTISTTGKNTDWHYSLVDTKKSHALASTKSKENLQLKSNIFAKGDGPRYDLMKTKSSDCTKSIIDLATDMKTLKSEFKEYPCSKEDSKIEQLDMKYVTIRPSEKTYVVNQVVSSTADKSDFDSPKFGDDVKMLESSYQNTPVNHPKNVPRRKLSVYNRSFDIESVQTPDSLPNWCNEKRRSVSTPDVQETDFSTLRTKNFGTPLTKDQLLHTYRCANNSDSSISPSPKKPNVPMEEFEDASFVEPPKPIRKLIILAPTKFNLPDSTVGQFPEVNKTKSATTLAPLRQLSPEQIFQNDDVQQSRILSSSSNLKEKSEEEKKAVTLYNVDSSNVSGTVASAMLSNTTTVDMDCSGGSDNVFLLLERNDKTYTKITKNAGVEEAVKRSDTTGAPDAVATVAATSVAVAAVVATATSASVASDAGGSGASGPAVGRAMSSGEDSSAESECNAGTTSNKSVARSAEPAEPAAAKTDNLCNLLFCNDNDRPVEKTVQIPPMLSEENESSRQKVIPSTLPQETPKEDESPKAFPSWTDEKLQESGIASFPDVDSEINETLSEEELKKKYTAFSVGLSTDRMTLSKRMILSRRHRDQAETNFSNEVLKMHQDIKELAPLCVDSESVERVERVKQQLEMVARCTHRISCDAETLGAVHQERRVSRAVLLADKYLQTLRHKCEKLASELAETKKILAENNIVIEENLSEMGDDVPRVRYRAVPNNNRTMMARRRASIATISRPLLGSNQDISKELPRQRNSVSGRVPGLRRPSLCFETPKWEMEKLDRTDSSSSIAELRDIFEQAESRRHSREENNNLIRTSINNLSTLASDHTEEIDVWSNSPDDVVPEILNDQDHFNEIHHHRHPIVCWIVDSYATWKSMIWVIFIAFLLGFFMNRVVSSGRRNGPPMSWWSLEELLNQYTEVENNKNSFPKPI